MFKCIVNYVKSFFEEPKDNVIIKEYDYTSSLYTNYFNDILVDNLTDITEIILKLNTINLRSLSKDDIINCMKKFYSEHTFQSMGEVDFIVFDSYDLPILKIVHINGNNFKNKFDGSDKYNIKQYFFKYEKDCK